MHVFAIAFYLMTAPQIPLKIEVVSSTTFDSCMLEAQKEVSKNVLAGSDEGLTAICKPL